MNLDLNLIRCFRTVAEVQSISKASQLLHLSQPALSLQIKRLEDQLEKKVFDRHNRGLILTKFGEQLLEKSQRLLEVENELLNLVRESDGALRGTLKIGTYTTASSYLLSDVATEFLEQNPQVSIRYNYDDSRTLLEKIKDYRLDCAVLTDVPDDGQLDIKPFFRDELVFAISSKSKKAIPSKITPKQLAEFDFLSYPLRYDLCYRTVEAKFGAHLRKARIVLETESFDTLKQMLLRGAGATFIPRYLIKNELDKGLLKEIRVGHVSLPITFSMITKKSSDISHVTRAFSEIILSSNRY